MDCSTTGFPVLHHLLVFSQTHVHWMSDAIQPSHPLSPSSPFALSLSQIRVFANESTFGIRWKNYWSFSFSISPSNEYLVLISFRIYWFDLLAVQETLKSLLQHHSLKASIFNLSALLMVQLSHPYMATRKTIALTSWIFVGNIMSLLFNMLFRFIIAFLPRKNRGWDGWMASPTQWTWLWASSRRQWRTGKPGVLHSMGSQRVRTTAMKIFA